MTRKAVKLLSILSALVWRSTRPPWSTRFRRTAKRPSGVADGTIVFAGAQADSEAA